MAHDEATTSPSPPPLSGPPPLTQAWRDAVFVHWRVDPDQVAPLLPAHTRPDVLDGTAHVGLVAFRARSTTALAAVPLGGFNEVNVRVYSVDRRGRQGVVFLSMDADAPHIVMAARLLTGLPYTWSDVSLHATADGVRAGAVRRRAPGRGTRGHWRVAVEDPITAPSPMEHFLTARWGLHTAHLGATQWLRVTHEPWPLYRARLLEYRGDLLEAVGLSVTDPQPVSVLWSPGVTAGLRPTLAVAR
ncbi:hypothetical protein DFP74_4808 [Nocardiopsis sp. Huas11]|uniref:YqjF family protein n=1 Tax=Nocardiopsis sp. Huas11 TaxID=2183912 RepID=UPI000EB4480E|nr:DUF2071 domain-containing protein [Nocardiopsis sp. Huas11]RKS09080.1 hypothetical protein DFP74_4808 [Nocardiopsis sp. Huas11]